MIGIAPLPQLALPPGIRSRIVADVNGLAMHVLEAGFEDEGRPGILLLHGFPELAYSWRKVMLPLASAGFRVVAPDQRGYGRTTGWDGDYDGDLGSFRLFNLVRDAVGLVAALGLRSVALEPAPYDCVTIVTDHSGIDYADVVAKAGVVVDFRNATRGIKSDKVWKL